MLSRPILHICSCHILLVFICSLLCVSVAGKEKNKKKEALNIIYTPEPDPLAIQPQPHSNIRPLEEVSLISDSIYAIREGIDVSHYQGTIDWAAVAATRTAGYVYIKASEGASLVDDCYAYNIREARRYGLKVGSYHFFRGNVPVEIQLANMTACVKKEEQDLIPIVDVEHTNGVSNELLASRLHQFMEALTRYYGKKPMLYTFVNFYNKHLQGKGFEKYMLMLAFYRDYQPILNDGRRYAVWQYTARGNITGIKGHVDRSRIMEGFTLKDISL